MVSSVWRVFVVCVVLALLAGCSDGSVSSSPGEVPDASVSITYAVDVVLVDTAGDEVDAVHQGAAYVGVATVYERRTSSSPGFPDHTTQSPLPGAMVTFTTTGGVLAPASGQVVTDDDGQAEITFTAGSVPGGARLTAAAKGVEDTYNFSVAVVMEPTITLTLMNSDGLPVSSLLPNAQGKVRVLARSVETRQDGTTTGEMVPAEGALVTVSSDGGVTDPENGQVLTDSTGHAVVLFKAGAVGGGFLMNATATIDGTEVEESLGYRVVPPEVAIGLFNIEQTQLGSGGSTAVHVTVIGPDGAPYQKAVEVRFASDCAAHGAARITPSVVTINGVAVANYTATTCTGTDTITAALLVPGRTQPITASGTVHIAPPEAGSIVFVGAEPTSIALRGHGSVDRPEDTRVTFRVTSDAGAPVPGKRVKFALTSVAGGLHLLSKQGQTDGAGEVSVRVRSGAVPVVFRVMAGLPGTGISTQSGQITVSTGYPVQGALSLSAEKLNPEAWNYDGVEVGVMARAADAFGNPVPDGTLIQFTTEGGSISPSCATVNGACEVMWRSQAPRPMDGRVTILATTPGDEDFVDQNGNGRFDQTESWQDMPEAFRDDDESGDRGPGEFFLDANGDGYYSQGNGLYDGALCQGVKCGATGAIDVRDDLVLTMSTSSLIMSITPDPVHVNASTSRTVRVAIRDRNGNLPPVGTTVEIGTSQGELSGTTSLTVGNSNGRGPWVAIVTLAGTVGLDENGDPLPQETGAINVTATTPNGTISMMQAKVIDGGSAGGSGCKFSPCPGGGGAPLMAPADFDALALNTEHLDMPAPGHRAVGLSVMAINAETPFKNVPNVTGVMHCNANGGVTIRPQDATFITSVDSRGQVMLDIEATAPGSGACRFQAGPYSATFTVEASAR